MKIRKIYSTFVAMTNRSRIHQDNICYIFITLFICVITGCTENKQQQLTPWGTPLNAEEKATEQKPYFTINDIQESGEMIMLTTSGPDTYFEYHGKSMGTQYLLCEKFAQKIGVSLRVEVCKTIKEMTDRLKNGEADIIACQIPKNEKGVITCGYAVDSLGTSWAVKNTNKELADSLNAWYRPSLVASIRKEEKLLYSTQSTHRHTYAPMLNAKAGIISQYDHLFIRYASIVRWDWRLLAAQCYQESCFDPKAYSWAGARGLMQIMPATAEHLGLPQSEIHHPEQNIYAAVRYIAELNKLFQDIPDPRERQNFILASYNGGHYHIRDAMALAKKYGRNAHRWSEVKVYVLNLQLPKFYNDPICKHGYMRGEETANYVDRIRDRYNQYCGFGINKCINANMPLPNISPENAIPHQASKKHRFKL